MAYQLHNQRFLVAQVRKLLSKLIGLDKLFPARIASISTNSRNHVAMRQKLAPPADNSFELTVLLLLHKEQ